MRRSVRRCKVRCYFGHLTSARAFMSAGADVNVRCGLLKRTVLSLAAEKGHVDILRALVKHGADVTAVDNDRDTALHVAAQFNRAEVIDALVDMGTNIEASNRIGCTPLHLACHMLRDQAVVALSKRGANINARDVIDQTPLHHASSVAGEARGTSAVVDLLLRLGADETIVDKRKTNAAGLLKKPLWACLYPGDAEHHGVAGAFFSYAVPIPKGCRRDWTAAARLSTQHGRLTTVLSSQG
ncbi:unnamed protein product [Ectocarpus sp. 8 AP-2014]